MNITLGNKDYTFLTGYRKEETYRIALSKAVDKIFNISFEAWYKAGYWNEKYIPYTLFDGEKAISNVSANIMDFNLLGEKKRYIQIGTVLTDENYRYQGLNRFLMQKVLQAWHGKCDFIYLFANHSVLEFYPKFGFDRVKEYVCFKRVERASKSSDKFEKLNMNMQSGRDLLYDHAKHSAVFGRLSMEENADLVMFYCILPLKENVYYIKSLDVVVIAKFKDNQLHLLDVFGKNEAELDKVLHSLMGPEIDEVMLGFTPKDWSAYQMKEITSGDEALFVQKSKTMLFDTAKNCYCTTQAPYVLFGSSAINQFT